MPGPVNLSALDPVVILSHPTMHVCTPQNSPKQPVLFLTNESETGHIKAYIQRVTQNAERQRRRYRGYPPAADEIIVPALWTVMRAGHNLVSEDERFEALTCLLNWVRHGTNISSRRVIKTVPVRTRDQGWARVCAINEWGSFFLDWQESDLKHLGVPCPGPTKGLFELVVGHPEGGDLSTRHRVLTVTWSEFPHTGIAAGSWLACPQPDGLLKIGIMSYEFTNAADQAGVVVGDFVRLRRKAARGRRRRIAGARKFKLQQRLAGILSARNRP